MPKIKKHTDSGLRAHAWKQFKQNKPAYISLFVLGFLALIALFAPVLANEKPLFISYRGEKFFPALTFKNNYEIRRNDGTIEKIQLDIADWKHMQFDKVIWAPIPWSPGKTDHINAHYKSPGGEQLFTDMHGKIIPMPNRFRHLLGTGNLGEDVLAGLIYGARISLTIGFISMLIASIIGLLLGSMAGYFGDQRLTTSRGQFWFTVIGIVMGWFYAFQLRQIEIENALQKSGFAILLQLIFSIIILTFVIYLFSIAGKFIGKLPWLRKKMHIPVDSIISRLIEIFHSLPTFILIITIAAIAKPSLVNLMVIIGFTSWTGIARLTRAEFLRLRSLEYIQAARSLGYSETKIILKHALPNGLAPALVAIAFGIATAILTESSLSFLGVGVPTDIVTWGSLVNNGRQNFSAWWLVSFPGLAIFITVTAYNLIGEGLRDALDPKLKK